MTAADILDADLFAETVGDQARAFMDASAERAIKAAVDEAEVLAGLRVSALTVLPDWFADPVARIALYVLSQTAEGWSEAQLKAAGEQYKRAVSVLVGRRGSVNPDGTAVGTGTAASGSTTGTIDELPSW